MDQERKGRILMKIGFKYCYRYIWYNPHDPWYLRYSTDSDYRGVRVLSIKTSRMICKEDEKINPKRYQIKFIISSTKSYCLYFSIESEYSDWKLLFESIRENINEPNSSTIHKVSRESSGTNTPLQENWWESRYGEGKLPQGSSSGNTTPIALRRRPSSNGRASPCLTRKAPIMVIVELPLNMGYTRLSLDRINDKVVTIQRFKERLFESLHIFLHSSACVIPTEDKLKKAENKYMKKNCPLCCGSIRPIISRQMFKQEQILEQGPEFFVFQIGSVFNTKEYRPKEIDLKISNERFIRGGGLFRKHQHSAEDDLLLKSFEYVHPTTSGNNYNNGKNKNNLKEEDDNMWVEDETIALSALTERVAPNRPTTSSERDEAITTTVIHLIMKPSRELPISTFFIQINRYTREYDAFGNFSLYIAEVKHGNLKWEVRRRWQDIKELDSTLRSLDSFLPKLPFEAKKSKFSWKTSSENDEIRFMKEMNIYLKLTLFEKKWDPPPADLLRFVGILSMGKNELLQNSRTNNHGVVHLDTLSEIAEFGDLVLFRSVNPLSMLQRKITGNCTFDHVGIVVKRKREGYELLEATGEGVTSYPLEERLFAYSEGFCDLIALRKVRFERSEEMSKALAEFTNQVEGKPYKLSLSKLAISRVTSVNSLSSERKREYFCSELTAEALRLLGVLTITGRPDAFFLPHFFEEGGPVEQFLTGGSSFDDILFVDCVKPEIKNSKEF